MPLKRHGIGLSQFEKYIAEGVGALVEMGSQGCTVQIFYELRCSLQAFRPNRCRCGSVRQSRLNHFGWRIQKDKIKDMLSNDPRDVIYGLCLCIDFGSILFGIRLQDSL